jgi:hypothetical protein
MWMLVLCVKRWNLWVWCDACAANTCDECNVVSEGCIYKDNHCQWGNSEMISDWDKCGMWW